jgi:hypothetical protein
MCFTVEVPNVSPVLFRYKHTNYVKALPIVISDQKLLLVSILNRKLYDTFGTFTLFSSCQTLFARFCVYYLPTMKCYQRFSNVQQIRPKLSQQHPLSTTSQSK